MRISILPASPKTGAATIRALLASSPPGLEIDALYRDPSKAPAEFTSRAEFRAVRGDIRDVSSLKLEGADAVLVITPPVFDGGDPLERAEEVSGNVREAVERAGTVGKVVLLSSVGAQFDHDVGEIKTNNIAERVFSGTRVAELVFVRAMYFMENWTGNFETLRGSEPFIFSTVTPLDVKMPMVAVRDIGTALAGQLLQQPTITSSTREGVAAPPKPLVFELHGPTTYSPEDVRDALSRAMGREVQMRPVERDMLREHYAGMFPARIVDLWVEMALSLLPGGILEPQSWMREDEQRRQRETPVVRGGTELRDAMREAIAAGPL